MGVRILLGKERGRDDESAVLFCSTSGWAFGPVFDDHDGHDADERVESFLRWFDTQREANLSRDPRALTEDELVLAHSLWLRQEAAQWAEEATVRTGCVNCGAKTWKVGDSDAENPDWYCSHDCELEV